MATSTHEAMPSEPTNNSVKALKYIAVKMQPTIISSSSPFFFHFHSFSPLASLAFFLAPFFHFSSDDDSRKVGRGTLKTRKYVREGEGREEGE